MVGDLSRCSVGGMKERNDDARVERRETAS